MGDTSIVQVPVLTSTPNKNHEKPENRAENDGNSEQSQKETGSTSYQIPKLSGKIFFMMPNFFWVLFLSRTNWLSGARRNLFQKNASTSHHAKENPTDAPGTRHHAKKNPTDASGTSHHSTRTTNYNRPRGSRGGRNRQFYKKKYQQHALYISTLVDLARETANRLANNSRPGDGQSRNFSKR